MSNKLLSNGNLDDIETWVSMFGEGLVNYADNIEKIITLFNSSAVVQSFYATGRFGQEQKEKLVKIEEALRKYKSIVADGNDCLVAQTRRYIAMQRSLNDTGQTAGAAVSGISAAMSGRLGQ